MCVCVYLLISAFVFVFLLAIYPGFELLGHMIVLFIAFLRNFHTVFHNDYTNLYSHQQWMSLLFSTTSSTLVIYCFLIKAILTGVKCYLTNILICISWRLVMLRIFLYAYWPSVYLLWKNNVSSIPLPIFVCLMLNCMSSLYILHIIPDQIYHL